MGKKTESAEFRDSNKISQYKWEFLRRNSGYREDFGAFMRRHEEFFRKHGICLDRMPTYKVGSEAMRIFLEIVAPDIETTSEKWGMLPHLYAPEKGGEDLLREGEMLPCFYERERGVYWMDLVNLGPDEVLKIMKEAIDSCESKEDRYRYQYLRVDLTQPLSDILDWVRLFIYQGQKQYRACVGALTDVTPTKRARFDKYETYINVWDLRERGMKFEQIAARVYPTEYKAQRKRQGRISLPVVQKVRDDYKRAKELIAGGYKEIN